MRTFAGDRQQKQRQMHQIYKNNKGVCWGFPFTPRTRGQKLYKKLQKITTKSVKKLPKRWVSADFFVFSSIFVCFRRFSDRFGRFFDCFRWFFGSLVKVGTRCFTEPPTHHPHNFNQKFKKWSKWFNY